MDADVATTEPEGQMTFKFAGKSYIGQCTPMDGKLVMGEVGYESTADFMMAVRRSQFVLPDVPPADNDVIEIDDVKYQVQVVPDQYNVVLNYAVKQYT